MNILFEATRTPANGTGKDWPMSGKYQTFSIGDLLRMSFRLRIRKNWKLQTTAMKKRFQMSPRRNQEIFMISAGID
jgi:hypothetical protein